MFSSFNQVKHSYLLYFSGTNEVFLVACLLLYLTIFLLVMHSLPFSFTLGELMIVCQTLTILYADYAVSIYSRVSLGFIYIFESSTVKKKAKEYELVGGGGASIVVCHYFS